MNKPIVVLTDFFHPEIIARDLKPKAQILLARTPGELKHALKRADALITLLSRPVGPNLLKYAPRLKVVGNYAVGINNIDLTECFSRGIRVINTPDVLTRSTAELALTLCLAAARRVPEGEVLCRSNQFKGWDPEMLLGLELKGRRALLVGRGRIGLETAKLFKGVGLRVEWITRHDSNLEIEKKLRRAQILSLHLPLTPQNHHWLNGKRLSLLRPDCIVINTARGPVVDEKALIAALKSRRIFAAGLDVYEYEPKIPQALRKLHNVVLLPHLGSATQLARRQMAEILVSGVLGVLDGKRPSNEVNPGGS